jgi:4-amino-4-deoxychorismate lyase
MSRLIETIRLLDGKFYNLSYHASRMQRAWKDIFNMNEPWRLDQLLEDQKIPKAGLFKCRVTYDTKLEGITFESYVPKEVMSLKVIHDDAVSYGYKFKDRSVLENHFAKRGKCDDVLIVKDGLVTDTSYANILFKKENEWITPESCLLRGTMRQQLIDKGKIRMERIAVEDISSFEKFKLINSMLLDEGPEIDVSNIVSGNGNW